MLYGLLSNGKPVHLCWVHLNMTICYYKLGNKIILRSVIICSRPRLTICCFLFQMFFQNEAVFTFMYILVCFKQSFWSKPFTLFLSLILLTFSCQKKNAFVLKSITSKSGIVRVCLRYMLNSVLHSFMTLFWSI